MYKEKTGCAIVNIPLSTHKKLNTRYLGRYVCIVSIDNKVSEYVGGGVWCMKVLCRCQGKL
jgi:hypothetical protein